jgi:hypothetical protein
MYKTKRSSWIVVALAALCIATFSTTLTGCIKIDAVSKDQSKEVREKMDEISKRLDVLEKKYGITKEDKEADSLKSK